MMLFTGDPAHSHPEKLTENEALAVGTFNARGSTCARAKLPRPLTWCDRAADLITSEAHTVELPLISPARHALGGDVKLTLTARPHQRGNTAKRIFTVGAT